MKSEDEIGAVVSVSSPDDIVNTGNSQRATPTGPEAMYDRTGRHPAGHMGQPNHTLVAGSVG